MHWGHVVRLQLLCASRLWSALVSSDPAARDHPPMSSAVTLNVEELFCSDLVTFSYKTRISNSLQLVLKELYSKLGLELVVL